MRVVGTACGLAIEGSGWVAPRRPRVTNAHVVAGESDTVVETGGDRRNCPRNVVVFDTRNDIALLRVPGLDLPPLALAANPAARTPGVILGYPEDGPFERGVRRASGDTQDVEHAERLRRRAR